MAKKAKLLELDPLADGTAQAELVDDPPELTADDLPVDAEFEEIEPEPQPAPRPRVDRVALAKEAVIAAEQATERARARVRAAQLRIRGARMEVSRALANWQASYPVITREQLCRAEAAADQAHRIAVATGQIPAAQRPRVGDSRIDEIASYGGDGGFRRGMGKFRRFRGQKIG